VLGVAGLLAAGGALWWQHIHSEAAPGSRKIMLAVLPFENLSGDAAQDYFSNGLTEEMITQLGRLEPERLGVIARTSAMQYKGARKDARQIGTELGVDYLLEGSVRREGSRVRVSAQLIQVRDQSHRWAEDYDRDLRDILALQSEVAGTIAQQIRLKLTPEQHARLQNARAVNAEAYEDYLKGRFFWNKRSVEGHQKAIEYFQKAVALDPNYAQAYAGLADSYALLGSWSNLVMPRREAMSQARAAAEKALALDDSLADAHASLGFVKMHYDWDFSGAEKEFQRAIALNPGYATAHHWYAYDLVALARLDDALAEIRRAQQTDPLSVIISRDVGELLLFAGRDDEAIAQCHKTLEMDPNFSHAHWVLAWAYRRKGQEKQFLEELAKSTGDPVSEGILYVLQGKRQEALRILGRMERNYGSAMHSALVYWFLGEKDRAFVYLERAFEERNGALIVMRFAPEWEPLRSDPRFEQLERRVGVLH
jgi:TolB-like protein/Tfp pilus assembly protein PilF